MTLQHGKFYIDKEKLTAYLGLPENTHLEVKDEENGIEIYAVSDKENLHLIKKTNNNINNLRRTMVPLYKYIPKTGVVYKIYENKFLAPHGILEVSSDDDAIAYAKENLIGKTLVKEEVLFYEKMSFLQSQSYQGFEELRN